MPDRSGARHQCNRRRQHMPFRARDDRIPAHLAGCAGRCSMSVPSPDASLPSHTKVLRVDGNQGRKALSLLNQNRGRELHRTLPPGDGEPHTCRNVIARSAKVSVQDIANHRGFHDQVQEQPARGRRVNPVKPAGGVRLSRPESSGWRGCR